MSEWPSQWVDALTYLEGVGFRDLYLGGRGGEARLVAPTAASIEAPAAQTAPPRVEGARVEPLPPATSSPPAKPAAPVIDPMPPASRAAAPEPSADDLTAAASEAAACTACRLCDGRKKVVFGSGHPEADLMFIGEGPGAEEDRQGLPFVGPAGALLTRIIAAIGHQRESVYIANVVKCRPPRNRDPQPDEVAACWPFLERQIAAVKPRVIVALGRVAAQCLLKTDAPLGRLRGRWHEVAGVPTRATYHPAALLRNTSFKRPTWEDMQIVRDRLLEEKS